MNCERCRELLPEAIGGNSIPDWRGSSGGVWPSAPIAAGSWSCWAKRPSVLKSACPRNPSPSP